MNIKKLLLLMLVYSTKLLSMELEPKKQVKNIEIPLLIVFTDTKNIYQEIDCSYPVCYFLSSLRFASKEEQHRQGHSDCVAISLSADTNCRIHHYIKYINEHNNASTIHDSAEFVEEYKKFLGDSRVDIDLIKVSKYIRGPNDYIGSFKKIDNFSDAFIKQIFTMKCNYIKLLAKKKDIIKRENKDKTSYLYLLPIDVIGHFDKFLCSNNNDEYKQWEYLDPLFEYHEQALKEIEQEKEIIQIL